MYIAGAMRPEAYPLQHGLVATLMLAWLTSPVSFVYGSIQYSEWTSSLSGAALSMPAPHPSPSSSATAESAVDGSGLGELYSSPSRGATSAHQQPPSAASGRVIITFREDRSDPQFDEKATATSPSTQAAASADVIPPASSSLEASRTAARLSALRNIKQNVATGVGVKFTHELDQLPLAIASVSSSADIASLQAHPSVAAVERDGVKRAMLVESLPMISQAEAAANGYRGEGCYVAMVDTGVDFSGEAFGRCSQPGYPDTCRVAYSKQYAAYSNGSLLGNVQEDRKHGTNTAAIVLGVAPAARILSFDVFGPGSFAMDSDILCAINDALRLKRSGTYNVCAINLSLGSNEPVSDRCAGQFLFYEVAFSEAVSACITPVVAAGNHGQVGALGAPACVPGAVSVGAVYDSNLGGRTPLEWGAFLDPFKCTDRTTEPGMVPCFSNTAHSLSLLAPGAIIDAGGFQLSGTSQAAPHVAGAVAILKALHPQATLDQILDILQKTGTPITDRRNASIVKPLINVNLAAATLKEYLLNPEEPGTQLPQGTIFINDGAPSTFSLSVNLTVTTNSSQVSQMCIQNAGDGAADEAAPCATWAPFKERIEGWRLADGRDGPRTVRLFLRRDAPASLEPRASASDSIFLVTSAFNDKLPPTGSITIDCGAPATATLTVDLVITGSDASGVAEMCISNTANCDAWEPFGTVKWDWQLLPGPELTRSVFLLLKDSLGNAMTMPVRDTIDFIDIDAPVGSITINGGDPFTLSPLVDLTIAGYDTSGVTSMCIINQDQPFSCTNFEPFADKKVGWALASGPVGRATPRGVLLFLQDSRGNTMALPAAANISLVTPLRASLLLQSPAVTNNPQLLLSIDAKMGAGPDTLQMCITSSNSNSAPSRNASGVVVGNGLLPMPAGGWAALPASSSCGPWAPYARSKTWRLPGSPPEKGNLTIQVMFRDPAFPSASWEAARGAVVYDATPPVMTKEAVGFQATAWRRGSVSFTFQDAAVDELSGVKGYKVMHSLGDAPPLICPSLERWGRGYGSGGGFVKAGQASTSSPSGQLKKTTVSRLQAATTYAFRLCAYDRAGNADDSAIAVVASTI